MGCQITLPLSVASGDTPMESAVYLASTNTIYAVRGQWIYACDPTTGAVVNSGRFCDNVVFDASITTINNKLYIGTTYTALENFQSTMPGRDIFVVTPATLPLSTQFGWDVTKLSGIGPPFSERIGWRNLVVDSTKIYGWNFNEGVFSVDPTNLASYAKSSQGNMDDMVYDSFNDVLWFTDSRSPSINVWAKDFLNSASNLGLTGPNLGGITYCAAANAVYVVNGTEAFFRVSAAAAVPAFANFAFTTLHTVTIPGVISPTPIRIKACNVGVGHPFNGKVLIPTWKDDGVIVWDPVTDLPASAVFKSGFSAPIDIVYTPTKAFAVQNSSVGLKVIMP